MKTSSCVIGAVAFAVVALSDSSVSAQDVIVKRGDELEGAVFTALVDFTAGGACAGDYTFTSVPSNVVQSSPDGECVADADGLSHKATCSGATLSSYTTFAERNCEGAGEADTDAATCVSDPSYASKSVCFGSEAGGLLAKGRLYTSLDACKNGDYFSDSVEYWGQYVPPAHANKCMHMNGYYVKHACGTTDGHSFSTYYTDAACTNVTQPDSVTQGVRATFGNCKEIKESGGSAVVFEECVTFISKIGAGGRADLAGGLAVVSMVAALSLLLNSN